MAISDLLKSNLRQIRSFKNMAPRILRHFKNKAAVNENWTTVFEKTETDSFYGADSQGIYITAMLFPKHQFEAQAEMKFSEAPKHFRSFLDCPVSIKHTNIIVGHVKEIKFDDDGMWGKLYIYAPMNNQNYLEKQREIKEGIMSGKYKQISIAYDMDIDENGNKRWFPVEMSVVEDSRVEVGNFKRVSFSKKIGERILFPFFFVSYLHLSSFFFFFFLFLSTFSSLLLLFFLSFSFFLQAELSLSTRKTRTKSPSSLIF
jgi:hypothetical protein